MEKEHLAAPSKQTSSRSLDLDISARLIAERMVGEILGWDLVDWSVVEPHKGKKFFFGRQPRGDRSIYHQLKPLFDRCDPGNNDFSALKPSPIVNANLSKLVGYLCRHLGEHGLPTGETEGRVLERTAEQDHLHLAATHRLLDRIENDPAFGKRAELLKQIAAAAESELERHFADLINQRLESGFLPSGNLDPYKMKGLRGQALSRVAETQALNERELGGLAVPDLALDDEALTRIEMAKILLSRFPYVCNYELMLLAELAMLQQPLAPRFVSERMLAGKGGAIDAALVEHLDNAIAGMAAHLSPSSQDTLSLRNWSIAICGSGPLPMSALFLHLFTGATIHLIDDDQAAIERSKRLIANLERLEILPPGVLTTHHVNAGRLNFRPSGMVEGTLPGDAVACDAVMIASLVDADAKASIAKQFSSQVSPEFLIMRSAAGLSAKLAYDPVPTETVSRSLLAYCGETLPAPQVATHLDRTEAILRRVASVASPDVLAIAHPDVVNTTEIYRKLQPIGDVIPELGAFMTIEDWIKELKSVEAASLGL